MKSISDFFENHWNFQLNLSHEKLMKLDWNDFVKAVSLMNIKSCGTYLERRILEKNGWTKITGHASHGDGRTSDGRVIEIKTSLLTPLKGSSVTFRGIRPWHSIDEHYCVLIDLKDHKRNPTTTVFMLDKAAIEHERNEAKTLRPFTGKSADRDPSGLVALGTSFKKGDLARWQEKYATKIAL